MPRKGKGYTRLSVHIGQEQLQRLEGMAKASDNSVAELVRRAVDVFFYHIDQRKQEKQ